MCKTKRVFFIDSNNRSASNPHTTPSGTDFTIDLDHPLTIPDGCGIALDSLSLPNTSNITPIVQGINNLLYCQLGAVGQTLGISVDGTDLAAFALDLQTKLNTHFSVSPVLVNVPLQWQRVYHNSTQVFDESVTYDQNFDYQYTSNNQIRTLRFIAFDINDSSATLQEIRNNVVHDTYTWHPDTKRFVGTTLYDWKLPDNSTIAWYGIYPNTQNITQLFTAVAPSGILSIEPTQSNAQFQILTDFQLKHDSSTPEDVKKNLKSANKYIRNLGNSSSMYSYGVPYEKEVDVSIPAFDSIFIRSSLSVDNSENIIKKIPLGSINETSFLGDVDVTSEGKTITSSIYFRVTDGYNNLIDFQGETLSFRLAFIE